MLTEIEDKMSFAVRYKVFHKVAVGVLALFFGIMLIVTVAAYSRRSGSTGLDMSKVQKIRMDAKKTAQIDKE